LRIPFFCGITPISRKSAPHIVSSFQGITTNLKFFHGRFIPHNSRYSLTLAFHAAGIGNNLTFRKINHKYNSMFSFLVRLLRRTVDACFDVSEWSTSFFFRVTDSVSRGRISTALKMKAVLYSETSDLSSTTLSKNPKDDCRFINNCRKNPKAFF